MSAPLGPEAAAVIAACESLTRALQHGLTALADISHLLDVLPALREVEQDRYRQRLADDIANASANAAEHEWQLVDNQIKCSRCPVDAGLLVLPRGAVPECDSNNQCRSFGRHVVLPEAGAGSCAFCHTVYPSTAEVDAVTR